MAQPRPALAIHTNRLVVRSFRPDDWHDLLEYLSLPEIYEFEPGEPIDAERARAMARDRSMGSAFLAVELRDERKMIGHLYFCPIEPASLQTWELGFIVNPHYQRQGFASEAVRGLIEHAFAAGGVHRVIAQCNPANVASWHVLERVGLLREGHLRQNIYFRCDADGRPVWQDTFEYGLLDGLEIEASRPARPTATRHG